MLGQNHKDRHRIKFELVVHQIDVVCVNKTKIEDINVIQLQLIFTGPGHTKEEITTEGVTTVSRKSIEQADYTLTWKQQPQLEFSANLIKHKGGLYDKDRKPPELFVTRKSDNGSVQKLGSAKLELYEHANRKVTGQFYEQEGKVVINLYKRKRLLSECEILVTFRIPDTDPSVIEEGSWRISSVITPSVSVETLNSNPPIQKSLKKPINKMLEDVLLIGIDGNIYKSNWNKMHLIFLVFGTLPDPIMNLRDLIHMLREHKQIGGYVEVVHICQAELPANNVMWPYLPFNDPSNSKFHDMFEIPEPYSEHPNIYVVNKKMTEYYAVRDYQVETYIEDRNVIELYDMWNKIPTVKSASHTDVTSPRQSLLHGQHSIAKSNSCGIISLHSHSRSSSYESSSLPLSSTRSSFNKDSYEKDSSRYTDSESSFGLHHPVKPPRNFNLQLYEDDEEKLTGFKNDSGECCEKEGKAKGVTISNRGSQNRHTVITRHPGKQGNKDNGGSAFTELVEVTNSMLVALYKSILTSGIYSFNQNDKYKLIDEILPILTSLEELQNIATDKTFTDPNTPINDSISNLGYDSTIPPNNMKHPCQQISEDPLSRCFFDDKATQVSALSRDASNSTRDDGCDPIASMLSFDDEGFVLCREDSMIYSKKFSEQKILTEDEIEDSEDSSDRKCDEKEKKQSRSQLPISEKIKLFSPQISQKWSIPKSYNNDINNMQEEISQQESEVTEEITEVDETAVFLEQLNEKLTVLRNDRDDIHVQNLELFDQINDLEKDKVQLQVEIDSLNSKLSCLYDVISALERDNSSSQTKSEELFTMKEKVSALEEENISLQHDNNVLYASFERKADEIRLLEDENRCLVQEVTGFKYKIEELNEEKDGLAKSQEDITRLTTEIARLKSEIGKMHEKQDKKKLKYRPDTKPGIRVVESKEYLDLEREHSAAKETISVLQQELVAVKQEMIQQILEREKQIKAIREELNKQQILSSNSQETLEECQRENIFFRHQVALRGTLGFRSGTFNMFKPRWFQLETLSPHNINPAISFYNGPDKLGEIVLNEIVKYDEISDTQFKITTKFANYVLSADSTADMRKWLTGIQNLQHTFCHVKKQSIGT